MAGHVLKYSEWESPTGYYFCNDTSNLSGIAGLWWVPARMLNLTPAAYIQWLVDNYKPDRLSFNNNMLSFSWSKEHYGLCHSFVLYINRVARNKGFIV